MFTLAEMTLCLGGQLMSAGNKCPGLLYISLHPESVIRNGHGDVASTSQGADADGHVHVLR